MTQDRRIHKNYQAFLQDKYWQKQHLVAPGEFFSSDDKDDMLVAETGTGIVICMYDPEVHIGGIAHVLIPDNLAKNFKSAEDSNHPLIRHIKEPLDNLIKALKQKGAGKKRVNIRMAGGASIMNDTFDIGLTNSVFCQNEIVKKGLNLITKNVGGKHSRRVHFFPYTGRMEKYPLRRKEDQDAMWQRESDYFSKIKELYP